MKSTVTPADLGARIRRLREVRGLSRAALARKIGVDVSSVAGWESGKRLPRDTVRTRLARALDRDLEELMSPVADGQALSRMGLLDVCEEFPAALAACARKARRTIRMSRLASPYPTTAHIQSEARQIMADRLGSGSLTVQRVEIFYSLERLKEIVSNMLRYDGRPYYVKAYCPGLTEVAPFVGIWAFDDSDIFVGGYWNGYPPLSHPVLRLSGQPVKTFFLSYWKEIWDRGLLLNAHGGRDLAAARQLALKMGLPARHWKRFVEEARTLEIGDGAPPLV